MKLILVLIAFMVTSCGQNYKIRYTLSVKDCPSGKWSTVYYTDEVNVHEEDDPFGIANQGMAIPELRFEESRIAMNICDYRILGRDTLNPKIILSK